MCVFLCVWCVCVCCVCCVCVCFVVGGVYVCVGVGGGGCLCKRFVDLVKRDLLMHPYR